MTCFWTEADSNRAQQIWSDYQQHHDVGTRRADRRSRPCERLYWSGESIQEAIAQRNADGSEGRCSSFELGLPPTIERAVTADTGTTLSMAFRRSKWKSAANPGRRSLTLASTASWNFPSDYDRV